MVLGRGGEGLENFSTTGIGNDEEGELEIYDMFLALCMSTFHSPWPATASKFLKSATFYWRRSWESRLYYFGLECITMDDGWKR